MGIWCLILPSNTDSIEMEISVAKEHAAASDFASFFPFGGAAESMIVDVDPDQSV
jgi:hypothetical protein